MERWNPQRIKNLGGKRKKEERAKRGKEQKNFRDFAFIKADP
jgi:hypothetical protein